MKGLNEGRYHGWDTPAEMEAEHERQQAWLELIGKPAPEWEDDDLAPPVDEDAIRAVIRGGQPLHERRRIGSLCGAFRTWCKAAIRIQREEKRPSQ